MRLSSLVFLAMFSLTLTLNFSSMETTVAAETAEVPHPQLPAGAGKLDAEEIALALDELDLDTAQLDEFYTALEEAQVDVVGAEQSEAEAEKERKKSERLQAQVHKELAKQQRELEAFLKRRK
jgi:hypothetical protein